MTGRVDDFGRALVSINLRAAPGSQTVTREAWLDTGFTGALMLPRELIAAMNLPPDSVVRGLLSDGSKTNFDTFRCFIDWFGTWRSIVVLGSPSPLPLIGILLMEDQEVTINYPARTVILSLATDDHDSSNGQAKEG